MTRASRVPVSTDRVGALLVTAVGLMLAVATTEYLFLELTHEGIVLTLLETSLFLGLAYSVAYGGYWLFDSTFDDVSRLRIAIWCLAGFVGTGAIATWVLLNQFWKGTAVQNPAAFGLAMVLAGAAAGLLVGVKEEQAREEAARATARKQELAVMNDLLRHHVLNGLNVIIGYTEELDGHVDGEGEPKLERIRLRSHRVAKLVRDFRRLTSSLSGRTRSETVDLAALLRREVAAAERTYGSLVVDLDAPEECRIRSDEALGAVFEHLIQNAVEHNDADRPRVDVSIDAADDRVHVRVADNGPGISGDAVGSLFERGRHGEDGLGLYVAKTLVSRYGGEIEYDRREPRGSVFTVTLDRAT